MLKNSAEYELPPCRSEKCTIFESGTMLEILLYVNQGLGISVDLDLLTACDDGEVRCGSSQIFVNEFPSPRQDLIEKYLAPLHMGEMPSGINPMTTHRDILGEYRDENIFYSLRDALISLYTFIEGGFHTREYFRECVVYLNSSTYISLRKQVNAPPCALCGYLVRSSSPQTQCGYCSTLFDLQLNGIHPTIFPEDGYRHSVHVLSRASRDSL